MSLVFVVTKEKIIDSRFKNYNNVRKRMESLSVCFFIFIGHFGIPIKRFEAKLYTVKMLNSRIDIERKLDKLTKRHVNQILIQ